MNIKIIIDLNLRLNYKTLRSQLILSIPLIFFFIFRYFNDNIIMRLFPYLITYISKIIITKFNIIKEILIYRCEDFTSLLNK